MTRPLTALLMASALCAPALAPADAQAQSRRGMDRVQAPAMDARDMEEDGLVLSGTIEEVFGEDGFVMDFGQGTLAVATGDLYEANPGFRLRAGEDVTVFARTNAGLFQDRIVDADAVFARQRDAFARTQQPPAILFYAPMTGAASGTSAGVTGEVSRVRGRAFEMDANGQTIVVDTNDMRYDPLDDIGAQQIAAGDIVVVYGPLTADFLDGQTLRANRITSMESGRQRRGAAMTGMGSVGTDDDRADRRDRMAERRTDARDDRRMDDGRSDERDADSRRADARMDTTRMDGDRSRRTRTAERAAAVPAPSAGPSEAEDFDEFESYDRNGDGVVTHAEYVRVAARPGNVTRQEASRLFDALSRGDRLLTKREFLKPSARYERLAERYLTSS